MNNQAHAILAELVEHRHKDLTSHVEQRRGQSVTRYGGLASEVAYELVEALHAAEPEIPWEEPRAHVSRLGSDAEDTPLDVPLHPGAARWYKEHAT